MIWVQFKRKNKFNLNLFFKIMFMFNLDNLLFCPLSLIVKQGLGKTQPLERNQ